MLVHRGHGAGTVQHKFLLFIFLPAAERTGLCLAHVTHICGYACGYAPDIWLLGALALRYDYTDTIQSSSV